MAYDVVDVTPRWFLHHGLFDLSLPAPPRPSVAEAVAAYRALNHAFARAVIDQAEEGAVVLVQDYHLSLVGTWLAQERPDLRAVHFTHTPFCHPDLLQVLPTAVAEELLGGMASHRACRVPRRRRRCANFAACCSEVLQWVPATFVAPIAPDPAELEKVAASAECAAEIERLDVLDGRRLIAGSTASSCRRTCCGASSPSTTSSAPGSVAGQGGVPGPGLPVRGHLPEYLAYRQEVEVLARLLNHRWATPGWIRWSSTRPTTSAASVAALVRYDVLLVNPVRDGLNLGGQGQAPSSTPSPRCPSP